MGIKEHGSCAKATDDGLGMGCDEESVVKGAC